MKYVTDDLRITGMAEVIAPVELIGEEPLSEHGSRVIFNARAAVADTIHGRDPRLTVIVGPCSIHDPAAALDYAQRLAALTRELDDALLILMRVYFEKPRTTVGWKGLINDPLLDNSYDINRGLRTARRLLLSLTELGIVAATEYLDPITPQYLGDAVTWSAIGARTTESQIHRQLASGLSCPVGFKNGTDGSIQIAVDALRSAAQPHIFLSVTKDGHCAIFSTEGNRDCHIILRGSNTGTNFDATSVQHACDVLRQHALPARLMVDASHGNSAKDPARQIDVADAVARQMESGAAEVMGIMLESNIVAGRQDVAPVAQLRYGQSITDGCIGWEDTVSTLQRLAAASRQRIAGSNPPVTTIA